MPICETSEDNQCALRAMVEVKPTDPTSKPCHRLQYTRITSKGTTEINKIEYNLLFKDPPMMTVKEEYLIYDFVGLISSVGGILGICVGISLYGITETLVNFMMVGMNWVQKLNKSEEERNVRPLKQQNGLVSVEQYKPHIRSSRRKRSV